MLSFLRYLSLNSLLPPFLFCQSKFCSCLFFLPVLPGTFPVFAFFRKHVPQTEHVLLVCSSSNFSSCFFIMVSHQERFNQILKGTFSSRKRNYLSFQNHPKIVWTIQNIHDTLNITLTEHIKPHFQKNFIKFSLLSQRTLI